MTAAHCVSDSTVIKIEEAGAMTGFEGRCERGPKFPSDPSQDWALCSLTTDYPPPIIGNRPPGFYEVLNTDPSALKKRDGVQITGFGCTSPGDPLDNIYRVGWAEIDKLPGGVVIEGKTVDTPNVLRINGLPSYLCEGDSGGPAFEIDEESPSFRRVIGINSQTINYSGLKIGYLASTSTEDALHFFDEWAKAHKKKICGLHEDAENCRPTKP
jgi:hypothetical protein